MTYSLAAYQKFLEKVLGDSENYSIPGLRQRAMDSGFEGTDLTRFTESLIWCRSFHDFPAEGDGSEMIDRKAIPAWSGKRWKSLLDLPVQTARPTFFNRLLKLVA